MYAAFAACTLLSLQRLQQCRATKAPARPRAPQKSPRIVGTIKSARSFAATVISWNLAASSHGARRESWQGGQRERQALRPPAGHRRAPPQEAEFYAQMHASAAAARASPTAMTRSPDELISNHTMASAWERRRKLVFVEVQPGLAPPFPPTRTPAGRPTRFRMAFFPLWPHPARPRRGPGMAPWPTGPNEI